MQKYPRLHKPENYVLSEEDVNNIEEFDDLLEHLTNVVESEPLHKIGLTSVGVGQQKAMVSVATFENPKEYTPILCEISTGVDLQDNRGVHMSRYIESIFTLAQKKYQSLDDFAVALATMVLEKQGTKTAFAKVTGTYIHKRSTRKTQLASYDSVELISKALVTKSSIQCKTGMKVQNATACPCTKTYMKYSVVPRLKASGLSLQAIHDVLDITAAGSHMQLGPTILMIDKEDTDISHKQIYDVLDKSLHLVYELLKRPDEHDFVEAVLGKPQFTEDAVREVAYTAYGAFKKKLSPGAGLFVKSVLQDSIHAHDVRAIIKKTFGEIESELGQ